MFGATAHGSMHGVDAGGIEADEQTLNEQNR
jgi:hypothetical protein